ncbi:replication-associated recombination protein A [Alkalibacter saccharofermentans]|uniref:Replication-associated recombination protein A n=1 Tax=Alkalibacter saccharofermentans DSM 14828 TaxID=1120975 RepID=A0A1M4S710_9FIRM|nr:replication-associated recombination protein A [Alkalibacter saccharofermentans]SHE27989.1 putative ATPase [Alkalibacter saccharofermentans DSM 14828]
MQQDFFTNNLKDNLKKSGPLASRVRPTTLEGFYGQKHILAPDKLLFRMIEADRITSIILYGPPGTGKTTLARIIANKTKSNFIQLNAVTSGVKELREVIGKAKEDLGMYSAKTILFIDEIHRFNKSQQDALLPAVEEGTVVLIGATTENPYFEVNAPLVSRSRIFRLNRLSPDEIRDIMLKALRDKENGLGSLNVDISPDALRHIAQVSNGDARNALNALELAVLTTDEDENGIIAIDIDTAQECIQKRVIHYDKDGDNHYDNISAFIKSIRGSDPDGALYWMSKMLWAGEDPKFIARRIIISASEDIGNADPNALNIAVSAFRALEIIGMPEARLTLAQAVTYLACSPKSNASYIGVNKALSDIQNKRTGEVPMHLRDAHYKGAKSLGHGKGYKYPHDYEQHYVKQSYMPPGMEDVIYYEPTELGYEKVLKDYLDSTKNKNK